MQCYTLFSFGAIASQCVRSWRGQSDSFLPSKEKPASLFLLRIWLMCKYLEPETGDSPSTRRDSLKPLSLHPRCPPTHIKDASGSCPSLVLYAPVYLAHVFPVNPAPAHVLLDQSLLWVDCWPLHSGPRSGTLRLPRSDAGPRRLGQEQPRCQQSWEPPLCASTPPSLSASTFRTRTCCRRAEAPDTRAQSRRPSAAAL